MSYGFLLFIVLLGGALGITAFLNNRKKAKLFDADGVPKGKRAEFDIALTPGSDGLPLMYDLTTCRHCVRVHSFLLERGIDHHDVYVDHFTGEARALLVEKVRSYNPKISFPTLVFPNGTVIIGYKESEMIQAIDDYKNMKDADTKID